MNVVLRQNTTMTERFYNFYKSPDQLRRLGARGGRISAHRRARAPRVTTPVIVPRPAIEWTTTAQDIARLDARFPWLRGAEKRES